MAGHRHVYAVVALATVFLVGLGLIGFWFFSGSSDLRFASTGVKAIVLGGIGLAGAVYTWVAARRKARESEVKAQDGGRQLLP